MAAVDIKVRSDGHSFSLTISELSHISRVRTHIQNVKPKMAEFEEL